MKKVSVLFLFLICFITGCNNFLEGSLFKKNLEDNICYQKSDSVNIKFNVNREKSGSFSAGEKSVKVGYSTEIQFNLSSEYEFDGFSVVRSSDGLALNNIVDITLKSSEYELTRGIYKFDLKLLENESDLIVLAKCHLKTDTEKPVFSSIDIYNTEDKTHPYYHKLSNLLFSKGEWFESDGITPKDELFHTNHVESLWINVKGIDADSGIKQICVKETLLRDSENFELPQDTYINYYGLDSGNNSEFTLIDSISKTYEYSFKYCFYGNTEGIIKLEFSLIDNAGNESKISDNVIYEVIRKVQNDDYAYLYGDEEALYSPGANYQFTRFSFQQLPYFKLPGKNFVPEKSFSFLVKYKDDSDFTPIVEKHPVPAESTGTTTIDSTSVKITEVKDYVNACFKEKGFRFDPTRYMDIKLCEWWENGTYNEYIYTNPITQKPFDLEISDDTLEGEAVKLFNLRLIDGYVSLGGNINYRNVFYTYQENEDSPAGNFVKLSTFYNNSTYHVSFYSHVKNTNGFKENFVFNKPGIYKFYVSSYYTSTRLYLYAPRGEAFTYYYNYGGTDTPSVEFPSKIKASYSHDIESNRTRIEIDSELPVNSYDYYFKIATDNKTIITKEKHIEIPIEGNPYTYEISVVARDLTGKNLGESAASCSLRIPVPDKVVFTSNNQDYNTPESFIEKAQFYVHSASYRFPDSFDYYFVPRINGTSLTEDYVKANFIKYTYKNLFTDNKEHDRYLQYYGLENGSYYLYVSAKDSQNENNSYFGCIPYRSYGDKVIINKALISQFPKVSATENSVKVSIPEYSDELKAVIPDFYKTTTADKITEILSSFYLDKNEWRLDTNQDMTRNNSNSESSLILSDLAGKSEYVKLYAKYYYYFELVGFHIRNSACFYLPVYICPSYYKDKLPCDSKTWISVENGKQIFCDAPTLVHTLYCPKKLTDTNTEMDAAYWEAQGQETGIMVKDKNFTYSDDNIEGVPEGNYYTTIVHFADGTVLMTPPVKKEK